MLEIDGSGGGQMLRTALSLSVVEGVPFRMHSIRADRTDPGLKRQHLSCIEVMQELSGATVDGAALGEDELVFEPDGLDPHDVHVDIGTAGSLSLLFQTVLPLVTVTDASFVVRAEGGTDVKWSPPVDYLERVALPVLSRFGVEADVRVARRGFYPDGGGIARLDIAPSELEETFLEGRGELQCFHGSSIASQHLRDARVAQRQRSEARRILRNAFPEATIDIGTEYVQSSSPGSSITLAAGYGETVLGADALGEKGKRSEQVAKEAADHLLETVEGDGAVDSRMADQVIPYLGLAGGSVLLPEVTDHVASCRDVVEAFLETEIELEEKESGVEARCT